MPAETTPSPTAHLSVRQVAEKLAVHRNTAFAMITNRAAFPNAIQVGRVWRVPQSDIDAYIAERKRLRAEQREAKRAEAENERDSSPTNILTLIRKAAA